MNTKLLTLLWLISLVVNSCVTKPRFTKTHKGKFKYNIDSPIQNAIMAQATAIPIENPAEKRTPKKYFIEMRDSIPHIFMNHIAKMSKSNIDTFVIGISKPFTLEKDKNNKTSIKKIDLSKKQFRINLSHIKTYFNHVELLNPSTRLEVLNTKITLKDTSFFQILSIDRITNETESIDLGSLKRNSSVGFEANTGGEIGFGLINKDSNSSDSQRNRTETSYQNSKEDSLISVLERLTKNQTLNENTKNVNNKLNASMALKIQDDLEENLNLKKNRLKTGYAYCDSNFVISQHAAPLNDIYDNIVVNITIEPKSGKKSTTSIYRFENIVDSEAKKFKPLDSIIFNRITVDYIKCDSSIPSEIKLEGEYEGLIRIAKNKSFSTSVLEYDDKIKFIKVKGEVLTSKLELNKVQFCTDVYKIKITDNSKEYFVYYSNTFQAQEILQILGSDAQESLIKAWFFWMTQNDDEGEFNKIDLIPASGFPGIQLKDLKNKNFKIEFIKI